MALDSRHLKEELNRFLALRETLRAAYAAHLGGTVDPWMIGAPRQCGLEIGTERWSALRHGVGVRFVAGTEGTIVDVPDWSHDSQGEFGIFEFLAWLKSASDPQDAPNRLATKMNSNEEEGLANLLEGSGLVQCLNPGARNRRYRSRA